MNQAGHWRDFEENASGRPYLMYDAINDSRVRPSHLALDGIIKPVTASTTPLDLPPPGVKNDGKRFARIHISQKPVELMRWCIDKVRPLAGLPILDPYMGSGSTAIAALSLGHTFIGCEIGPATSMWRAGGLKRTTKSRAACLRLNKN